MLKPSPKKDADATPNKKVVKKNTKREAQITKGVQTTDFFFPVDFPLPPDFISDEIPEEKEDSLKMEPIINKDCSEQAEDFQQEESREREERWKSDQELQTLEERAKKLRDEWQKEEAERRKEGSNLVLEKEEQPKIEAVIFNEENRTQSSERIEEERRKEILLAKMYEIDRETQVNMKVTSQEHTTNPVTTPYSLEKSKRSYQISETTEKLLNGFPEYDQRNKITKGESQRQQNTETTYTDLTFGSYVPSFGKGSGRPSWPSQKSDFLDDLPKENVGLDVKKERKSNLMEQLFGSSANTIGSPKINDLGLFRQDSHTDNNSQDKRSTVRAKDDGNLFFGEGKSFNPKQHRLQHAASKPAVKAIDYLEDEIEEVLLQ